MQSTFKQSDHYRSRFFKGLLLASFATCLFLMSGCDLLLTNWDDNATDPSYIWGEDIYVKSITPYSGVCGRNLTYCDSTLTASIIPTLLFDQKTVWPPKFTAIANSLLEQTKNPGFGVRTLQKKGITGKGVAVAFIGTSMAFDCPEIVGKVYIKHSHLELRHALKQLGLEETWVR